MSTVYGWTWTVSDTLPEGTAYVAPADAHRLPAGWSRLPLWEAVAAAIRAGVPLTVSPDVDRRIREATRYLS